MKPTSKSLSKFDDYDYTLQELAIVSGTHQKTSIEFSKPQAKNAIIKSDIPLL